MRDLPERDESFQSHATSRRCMDHSIGLDESIHVALNHVKVYDCQRLEAVLCFKTNMQGLSSVVQPVKYVIVGQHTVARSDD